MPGPLDGLRVIDVGTRIGAPFCAGLLGEWGAEVVKVEQPGTGDFMRTIGPFEEGYSLFWAVEGRGRKSATCDLRTADGQDLFRRLAATADVVCENFRPGTLEDWGIDPVALAPHLVVVRISAFGQDGPYAKRPGLDRLGVAYGGLLHLTGEADRPPVRPGVTVADYLTGVFAAEAALAALYRRDATPRSKGGGGTPPDGDEGRGKGAVIDASLYGAVLRILEWTIAAYDRLGTVRRREGNRLSNSAPLDNYPTADGRFVCVVAGSDANFGRLCQAMDRPDLLTDPRFATLADRARHGDEINGVVATWTASRTAVEVEEACVRFDVPVATAYTAVEISSDAHFEARRDLVAVDDPVLGTIRQQAPYPRLVGEAGTTPVGAPTLGADNVEVWCDMVGLTAGELDGLRAQGIV
ncbi:MAG TPA: CaiB/BaiF CoA-transferase family protein [Acidimicrobiales bacterium]|jgi:crotonobetainyl-CoA:carnitine CoA-transferase CaiB-like acyl-CoA transferase|nr:CaiB/BaiF CoA-transferase family protein [Acidimicrobiales bacterium]